MRKVRRPFMVCVGSLLCAALAGCGGGGAASPSVVQAQSAVPLIIAASPAPTNDQNVAYLTATSGGLSGTIGSAAASAVIVGASTTTAVIATTSANTVAQAPIDVSVSGRSAASVVSVHDGGYAELPIALPEQFAARSGDFDRSLRAALGGPITTPQSQQRSTASLPTSVGATAGLWAQNAANGQGNGSYTQVNATLAAVTAHAYIWIDSSLAAVIGDAATVSRLGGNVEAAYASDVAHFGSPQYTSAAPSLRVSYNACDANGGSLHSSSPLYVTPPDGRVNVFVVNPASLGSGVGGYFDSANLYTQAVLNCSSAGRRFRSNEAPFIYVGWNPANAPRFEVDEDVLRGTAHELQHLISFVNHVIQSGNPNAVSEDTWINEGLSMLAQDLAVNAVFPAVGTDVADAGIRAYNYLSRPQSYSITGFIGVSGGSLQYNCGNCYGGVYLLQRYLYDRFGDQYARNMDAAGAGVSLANLQAVTGQAPGALLGDFAVALQNSGTGASSDPRFTIRALNLRGTVTDQFGTTLSLKGPQPIATLAAGSTATYSNYLGANFYIALGSGAGGSSVTLHDQSGGTGVLAAAIWQH